MPAAEPTSRPRLNISTIATPPVCFDHRIVVIFVIPISEAWDTNGTIWVLPTRIAHVRELSLLPSRTAGSAQSIASLLLKKGHVELRLLVFIKDHLEHLLWDFSSTYLPKNICDSTSPIHGQYIRKNPGLNLRKGLMLEEHSCSSHHQIQPHSNVFQRLPTPCSRFQFPSPSNPISNPPKLPISSTQTLPKTRADSSSCKHSLRSVFKCARWR
mmetsp:Transcript_35922/g.143578  ORF Transcript_35922/g.143578 Transcript_35922/m.143578 type:complete len:213 (+) Transcript_35922:5417-6055(+)